MVSGESILEVALPLAGACLGIGLVRRWLHPGTGLTFAHVRGRALQDCDHVQSQLIKDPGGFRLGMCQLPSRLAYGHIAIVGATGSGKTLLQRLLMQSVLPRIGKGLDQRALIYDAKQDVVSLLRGMDLHCPIVVLNPLDQRSAAWDMAKDVTSPAAALQAAALLFPKAVNDANPFFSNAARHLLYGVMVSLILGAPGRWTLRHLLLILRSEPLLKSVLSQWEATRHLTQYCEHTATFQNILSTLLTRTAPYEIIAASWDRSSTRISLRAWLREESILVLGNDEDNRTAIDAMNQLIFKRITELVLAQPEKPQGSNRTTWVMLDEVRQAGRLEGLSALMTKGRSKGAAVVLGLQDINGLRNVYGREVADELIGQCNTKAILRLNSPETAKWAEGVVGTSEFLETRRSSSRNRNFQGVGLNAGGSAGESVSSNIASRPLVLSSEFMDLPETSMENGLSGVFLSPVTGAFKDTLPGKWLREQLAAPCAQTVNHQPRPEAEQYLRSWSDQDAEELGMGTLNRKGREKRKGGD